MSTELHMAHKLPINNSTSSVLGYLDLTEVRNKNRDVRIVDLYFILSPSNNK
jgi:hypothetical protein